MPIHTYLPDDIVTRLKVRGSEMYTSRDYWVWYEQSMKRHDRATHPHDQGLALADARAYLDLWFEAVEREILVQAGA